MWTHHASGKAISQVISLCSVHSSVSFMSDDDGNTNTSFGGVNSVVCDIDLVWFPDFCHSFPMACLSFQMQAAANASRVFSHFMVTVFGFSAAQRDAALRSEPHPSCGVDKRVR